MMNEAKTCNITAIARGLLQKHGRITEIVSPDAQDRAPFNFGRAARDVFPRNRLHGPCAKLRRLPYDWYKDFIIAGGIEHEFPDYFIRNTQRFLWRLRLNIPPERIKELAPQLLINKDAEIVTYCTNTHWHASEYAARELAAMGYTNVAHYPEGKQGWMEAGLPVEKAA
jgi:rhodanese-related sulfurtransferase